MAQTNVSISKQVYWHEGLFMRPQHLQQQDRFMQQYQYALHSLHNDNLWGVIELEINQAALQNEVLDITEFDVLYADGTRVCKRNNNTVLRRSFSQYWRKENGRIEVWLALRKIRDGFNNVSEQAPVNIGDDMDKLLSCHRYHVRADPQEVFDLYRDENHAPVRFLDYQLLILFGKEVEKAADFDCIKLAELKHKANRISLCDRYIPPIINIHSSGVVTRLLADLNEDLFCKYREFQTGIGASEPAETKAMLDPGQNMAAGTVWRQMITAMLNRYVCSIDHMLDDTGTTLREAMSTLNQLVAELQVWLPMQQQRKSTGSVERYIPYSHTCPADRLFPLLDRIRQSLAGLSVQSPLVVPLQYNGEFYTAELDEDMLDMSDFYLVVSANDADRSDLAKTAFADFHKLVKISSVQRLPGLIAHSLSGLGFRREDKMIPGQRPGAEHVTYKLNQYQDHWQDIIENGNIAVHVIGRQGGISLALVCDGES